MVVSAMGEDPYGQNIRDENGKVIDYMYDAGVVYVYEFNGITWKYTQTLKSDDHLSGPGYDEGYTGVALRFGYSVAINNNQIIVGMPYAKYRRIEYYTSGSRIGEIKRNIVYNDVGAVFVFEKINGVWTKIQRITPAWDNNYKYSLRFGISLATHGNNLVIGASHYTYSESYVVLDNLGAVFVATRDDSGSWSITQRITNPIIGETSKAKGSRFGSTVAIHNNVLVVGAEA